MQKYWCNYKIYTVFFSSMTKEECFFKKHSSFTTTTLQHKKFFKFRTVKAKKLRIDKLTEWTCIR